MLIAFLIFLLVSQEAFELPPSSLLESTMNLSAELHMSSAHSALVSKNTKVEVSAWIAVAAPQAIVPEVFIFFVPYTGPEN